MWTARHLRTMIFGALCTATLLLPTGAVTQDDPGEKAIKARQGLMQVVSWEAGPLFAMAKGDIAYDAETAMSNAENLDAIAQYGLDRLFVQGTTKANYTGKTRALAPIWEEPADFREAVEEWRAAVAVVAEQAGDGKDALTAAVSEMGKTCGNCHDDFRADEF